MIVACHGEPLQVVNVWLGSILKLLAWLGDVPGISDSQGSLEGYIETNNVSLFKIWAESFLVRLVFLHFYNARIVNSSILTYLIPIRTRWCLVKQDETTCVWEADTEIMSCICWLKKKEPQFSCFWANSHIKQFLEETVPLLFSAL